MKKNLLLIYFIISTTFFYSSLEGYQISMNNIQTGVSSTLNDNQSRIIYCGAGTSARIAVQDGAELFPTFGWPFPTFRTYVFGKRKIGLGDLNF